MLRSIYLLQDVFVACAYYPRLADTYWLSGLFSHRPESASRKAFCLFLQRGTSLCDLWLWRWIQRRIGGGGLHASGLFQAREPTSPSEWTNSNDVDWFLTPTPPWRIGSVACSTLACSCRMSVSVYYSPEIQWDRCFTRKFCSARHT